MKEVKTRHLKVLNAQKAKIEADLKVNNKNIKSKLHQRSLKINNYELTILNAMISAVKSIK